MKTFLDSAFRSRIALRLDRATGSRFHLDCVVEKYASFTGTQADT